MEETQQSFDVTQDQSFQSAGTEQGNEGNAGQDVTQGQGEQQQTSAGQEQYIPETQYKELQAHSTRQGQALAELTQKYQTLVDAYVERQEKPTAPQPTTQSLWDMDDAAFVDMLSKTPKSMLKQLVSEEASRQADERVKTLDTRQKALETIVNTQKVDATLQGLQQTYGKHPQFEQMLQAAVNWLTGEGRAFANQNPANALQFAFNAQLGQVSGSTLLSNGGNRPTVDTSKVAASPLGTSANVNQNPHGALTNQGDPNQLTAQLARQISTFGDEFNGQSMRPMKIGFNEL